MLCRPARCEELIGSQARAIPSDTLQSKHDMVYDVNEEDLRANGLSSLHTNIRKFFVVVTPVDIKPESRL